MGAKKNQSSSNHEAGVNLSEMLPFSRPFEDDEQVLSLLYHSNQSLFLMYVNKGYKISDAVIKEVIEGRYFYAFKIIAVHYRRRFKELAKNMTFTEIISQKKDEVVFSEELQSLVLDSKEPLLWQIMLCHMPLWPKVQERTSKFELEWLKMHVEHLYGVAGYRFEAKFESHLFEKLGCKNIDDCMLQFRQQDDASIVWTVSDKAATRFINEHWLSDWAQVGVILRGDANLIKVFIYRFTPEHGMCWQAEVEMVKRCSPEIIRAYIEFHSMCFEALEIIKKRFPELHSFYYTRHAY